MYYSMPINMFFIVKNHWEPSFMDNPRNNVTISAFINQPSFMLGIYINILFKYKLEY
jgi:hypothetical protein